MGHRQPRPHGHPLANNSTRSEGIAVKLIVDKAKCQGHAMCNAISESLFPIDDDGFIAIDTAAIPDDAAEDARRGVQTCPERAILLLP